MFFDRISERTRPVNPERTAVWRIWTQERAEIAESGANRRFYANRENRQVENLFIQASKRAVADRRETVRRARLAMSAIAVYNSPMMTTATTDIRTIEDLVRILDDNPEWRDALRARLLTRELLEMPNALAKFAEETRRRFDETNAEVNRRFAEVNRRFDQNDAEVNRRFDETNRRFDQNDERFDQNDIRSDRTERILQRLQDDVGILKAAHARNVAARDYGWMTRDMGLTSARILPVDEVDEFALRLMDDGVSRGDVQSFRNADMLIEATDARGEICYVAAEVSFTVDERDTRRAMRNAEYLAKLTGKTALAAVVGASFDDRVRALMDSGEVHWHPFSDKDLQVD